MPSSAVKKLSTEDRLDRVFHALSDLTRRALLRRLEDGPAMVTELAAPFRMSLPAVSKHLRVLEAAALIERRVDGRIHRCSLQAAPLEAADRWLERYRVFWTGRLDALARFVEDQE
ncbi:MAG: ArsR/SmtB family transcription factor [Stellaceae bacterium]